MPIYVEDASSGDDRLFHEWKLNKEAYKGWKKETVGRSWNEWNGLLRDAATRYEFHGFV